MQLQYVAGKENVVADALSRRPDYGAVEIPLVQGTGVQHSMVDTLVDDCFEALSRGRPVAE